MFLGKVGFSDIGSFSFAGGVGCMRSNPTNPTSAPAFDVAGFLALSNLRGIGLTAPRRENPGRRAGGKVYGRTAGDGGPTLGRTLESAGQRSPRRRRAGGDSWPARLLEALPLSDGRRRSGGPAAHRGGLAWHRRRKRLRDFNGDKRGPATMTKASGTASMR